MKKFISSIKVLTLLLIAFILIGKITNVEAATMVTPTPIAGDVYIYDKTYKSAAADTFTYELYHDSDYPAENDPTGGEVCTFKNEARGKVRWYNCPNLSFESYTGEYHYILKQLPNANYQIDSNSVDTYYIVIYSGSVSGNYATIEVYKGRGATGKASAIDFVNVEKQLVPELSIDKSVDNETPSVGDKIKYTIKASQTVEDAVAKKVVITDAIPEEITVDEDSINISCVDDGTCKYTFVDNVLEITIDELEYGKEIVITFDAEVKNATDDVITNTATIKADNADEEKTEVSITVKEPDVEKPSNPEKRPNPNTSDNVFLDTFMLIIASLLGCAMIMNKKFRTRIVKLTRN